MRIAYIAAGAAGMYCGSCLHDNTLAAALLASGHDVSLIPTYTPMRTDEADVSLESVYFGAVNVYLQQKSSLFRHTPRFLDRILDRPGLLNWVSRFAASTDARELGALTYSMLRGEAGFQQKELERLTEFVQSLDPEVIQLTNAMFLGIGGALRRRLNVPVVCGLTGEDLFLAELSEQWLSKVRDEMQRRATEVDGFIATSRYYAETMVEFLQIDDRRMHVVPLGITLDDYMDQPPPQKPQDEVTIGYLARICPEKGLQILIEAFRLLAADHPQVRLRVAGYLGARDRKFLAEQQEKVGRWGLESRVEFLGEVDREQKLQLLRGIDLFSVPTVYKEPKGLFLLEAWACGVPVVQPRHGAFPELIETSGGGVLVEPGSATALAEALSGLIASPEQRHSLGRKGQRAVFHRYGAAEMAARTMDVYNDVCRVTARGATV